MLEALKRQVIKAKKIKVFIENLYDELATVPNALKFRGEDWDNLNNWFVLFEAKENAFSKAAMSNMVVICEGIKDELRQYLLESKYYHFETVLTFNDVKGFGIQYLDAKTRLKQIQDSRNRLDKAMGEALDTLNDFIVKNCNEGL